MKILAQDLNLWKENIMKGGFSGPLCWYKAFMQKLTPSDDAGEYINRVIQQGISTHPLNRNSEGELHN